MNRYLPVISFLFFSVVCSSQNVQLNLFLHDAQTQLPVPSATVIADQMKYRSDKNGFLNFEHEPGEINLIVRSINYNEQRYTLKVFSDTSIVLLYEKVISLNEVDIVSSRISGFTKGKTPEILTINPAEISFFPGLGSNNDLLKDLQLLPGVQSGGEGSSGLIVRGGQYDQNLFNLNGFPLYQPYHFLGFISSIDPFMIQDVEIIKGGYPARYGGKLSSIVNFKTDKHSSDSVLSTIEAGLTIIGAATKFSPDSLSTIAISGRLGTLIALNKTLNEIVPFSPFYNFYDLNLNAFRKIDNKNDLSLTLYYNKDYINNIQTYNYEDNGIKNKDENIIKSGWHDFLAGITWDNTSIDNLEIKTSLFYQDFLSESRQEFHHTIFESPEIKESGISMSSSHILELGFTNEYYFDLKNHQLNGGLFMYGRRISPLAGTFLYSIDEPTNSSTPSEDYINNILLESGIFFEDNYSLNEKTDLRPGIRLTLVTADGSYYFTPEPRLMVSHKLSNAFSLSGSYSTSSQTIKNVSSSNAMVVKDLWIPVTSRIKPSKSYQGEIGFYYNPKTTLRCQINLYYKKMKELSVYNEGASFTVYPDWQDNIIGAHGTSFGVEFLAQANFKNTFILLAYTLSKTTRQSPEINNGKIFNFKYDKPHDLNITVGYQLNKKIKVSCNWIFQSGNMVSFYDREIQYDYISSPLPYLDKVNNVRFPNYHRLDFGLERTKSKKWGKKILKFDIYNSYCKLNPWYLTYDNGELNQVTLFPIIPSISYRIEF